MFIVFEIQMSSTVSTLVNVYEDRNSAESKYHQVLSAAAISSVPKHSAVLMNEIGDTIKKDSYTHEVVEES